MSLYFDGKSIENTYDVRYEGKALEAIYYKNSESASPVLVWEAGTVTPNNRPASGSLNHTWNIDAITYNASHDYQGYSYRADGNGYVIVTGTGNSGHDNYTSYMGDYSCNWNWGGIQLRINGTTQSTVAITVNGVRQNAYRITKGQTYTIWGHWVVTATLPVGAAWSQSLTGSFTVTPVHPD